MRITGGSARGIRLQAPSGKQTRPATDQMREAVFSSLGDLLVDAEVADWFAGTGAYGLEALSRGARYCTFFESDPSALSCLKGNLQAVSHCLQQPPQSLAAVMRKDLLTTQSTLERVTQVQVVFVDPPYEKLQTHWQPLLDKLRQSVLAPDGIAVFEVPGDWDQPTEGWQLLKRLGKSHRGKPNALLLSPLATHPQTHV